MLHVPKYLLCLFEIGSCYETVAVWYLLCGQAAVEFMKTP